VPRPEHHHISSAAHPMARPFRFLRLVRSPDPYHPQPAPLVNPPPPALPLRPQPSPYQRRSLTHPAGVALLRTLEGAQFSPSQAAVVVNGSSSSLRRRCLWLFLQAGGLRAWPSIYGGARASPPPAAVRGPRHPSDAVARLAAPRSGRQDADLAEKQRNPAVGPQHVHQVSGSRYGTSPAPPYPLLTRSTVISAPDFHIYNSEVSGSQD
jgi:hypothetical protein